MRRFVPIISAVIAVCALAGGSSAARLSWNETARNGKVPVMTFRVDSLTFGSDSWSAHVTLRNVSKTTIRIGNSFGAAIFADGKTENLKEAIGYAFALKFSPARPTKLAPGASWTGTIGGDGKLSQSGAVRYARVVFGPLIGLPGQNAPVVWVTNHRLTLEPTASSPNPNVI